MRLAMDMLARRERLEAEIRTALQRREFDETVIDHVVDSLRSKGYLNDSRAIRNAVDYSATERLEGLLKTRERLVGRGADETLVASSISEISRDDRIAMAVELIDRRGDKWRSAAQAARYLAGKGYEEEIIEAALAARFELESEIDEG